MTPTRPRTPGGRPFPRRVPTPMFVLPGLGYVVAAATGRGGLLVLASVIALVLAFGGLRLLWHEA